MTATIHRIAVLPSGREVTVREFVPLRAVETSAEAAEVVGGRGGYAYRPGRVFYTTNRGGAVVVRCAYRRARRALAALEAEG